MAKKQKRDISKHGYSVPVMALRLWGPHLTANFICLAIVLTAAAMKIKAPPFLAIIGVILFILYWWFMSSPVWTWGSKDANRVSFGYIKKDLLKGVKVGFLMSAPIFILDIFLILGKLYIFPYNLMATYKLVNPNIITFANFIETSVYFSEISWGELIGICSLTLVTPLIISLYYVLGYKDINPIDLAIYKRK